MKQWLLKLLRRFRRIITYGCMGVINTIVDYAVFIVCYEALNIPISISQSIGFISGSICGYLLNSNVTFREGKGRTKAQSVQYVGVDVVLTFLSSLFMHWVEAHELPIYIIRIAMTGVIALIHYLIYKNLVFRIRKEDSQQ